MMEHCTLVVLFAAVAICVGQDLPMISNIPLLVNMAKTGCPQFCSTLDTMCTMNPMNHKCDSYMQACSDECSNLEECIESCGTNCHDFVTSCTKTGMVVKPIEDAFCSVIVGETCDVDCLVTCPEDELLDVVKSVVGPFGIKIPAFAKGLFHGLSDS